MEKGELNKLLIKVSATHYRRSHCKFSKEGITQGQPRILNFLARNNGCIQRDIANCCNLEPATITSILSSMERGGLIYRKSNENDKRILNVFLTEEGKEAQKKVINVFKELENECFKGFSHEEKEEASRLLERIFKNMKEGEINNG